jgi:acetyltransferase-like isoleucine patch superfamily enzyme
VGDFCSIADGVTAITHGHNSKWVSTYPFGVMACWQTKTPGHPKTWDIKVGNDVWIGQGAVLMADVGDGAIVGAASVVRKDIPPYAIAYGNPCEVKGYRFTHKQIEALLAIAWWNWPKEKIHKFIPLLCSENIDEFIREVNNG